MTLTGLSFKDTALIECNDGYLYSRPEYSQRQCRSDGKWSGQEGFCQGKHFIIIISFPWLIFIIWDASRGEQIYLPRVTMSPNTKGEVTTVSQGKYSLHIKPIPSQAAM